MDDFLAACGAELRLPAGVARACAGQALLRIRRTASFEAYVRVLTRVPGAVSLLAEARRGRRPGRIDPVRRRRFRKLLFREVRRHAGRTRSSPSIACDVAQAATGPSVSPFPWRTHP